MKDDLGDKIKTNFEDALRIQLPRRTHLVIRIDGRRFHTFTKNLERPYDRVAWPTPSTGPPWRSPQRCPAAAWALGKATSTLFC